MSKSLFANPRTVISLDDCSFYHTVDIPGYGTIPGFWDIRGNESRYLGDVAFTDKRVLEIGPASGHLSFFIERQDAEVISIEAGEDYTWEFFWDLCGSVPPGVEEMLQVHRAHMEKLKNSYWFCHHALASRARVHYGSAYSVPRELGRFDVSVLACVLLHTKSPVRIIENCARITEEKIIIVEPFRERQFAQVPAEFLPKDHRGTWNTWWSFSPKFFVDLLRSMGFTHSKVTFHTQTCFGEPAELFTVVASRTALDETPVSEAGLSVTISSPVDRLKIQTGRLTNLPMNVVNFGEAPLSSFAASPVLMSYHWRHKAGEVAVWDGIRTFLPRVLHKGDSEDIFLAVRAPDEPGDYLLEISILEEGRAWYDDRVRGIPLCIETVVTAG